MSSDTQYLSELRIVLMGYKAGGKSSAGNIILNTEEFDLKRTAECVKRQREVADRHITVIEAPGWWINVPVDQSSELLKQEILFSVSLCPPGPHVVLLVISVDTRFKEDERKVFQGYVDLLSERVWSHTIVLFTHGDFLGDTSIEQHIESEGEDLQWLVEKCGNRYHVLNNKNRSDDTQIKDLLQKIEKTVKQNNGCHFNKEKFLHDLKQRRKAEKKTRTEQMRMMQKSKEFDRIQMTRNTTTGVSLRREHVVEELRSMSLVTPPKMSDETSTTAHLSSPAGPFSLHCSVSSMSSGYGSSSSILGSSESLGPSMKMNVSSSSDHSEQVELKD